MKRMQLLLLAATLCAPAFSFARSLDTAYVPASSKWVFHVDFDALRTSQFGRLSLDEIRKWHQGKLDAGKQLFGSDFSEDLYAMTVFGPDKKQSHAAAVFQGKFTQEKLISLLVLNGAYAKSQHNSYTLHHWYDEKQQKNQVGTFARNDMIVIAQTADTVTAVLDTLDGKVASLSAQSNPALHQLCQKGENALVITAATDLSKMIEDNHHAAILKNSNLLAMVLNEDSGIMKLQTRLKAENAEAAVQIESVIRGMIAFGSLSAVEKPDLLKLMQTITLTRTEETLELTAQYPSANLFEILQSHAEEIDINVELNLEDKSAAESAGGSAAD